jgi:tRNA acetyltransferase TAN1
MYFIITTPVSRQYDGMWEVQWAVGDCKIVKTRHKGLFLIEADEKAAQKIREYETTAVYKVIPLDSLIKADLPSIIEETLTIAQKKLNPKEPFAVRCKRRGFPVPSMEIEREIGAKIVEKFKNPVNLDNPEKIILIEIIDKKAGIAIVKESEIVKKEVLDL